MQESSLQVPPDTPPDTPPDAATPKSRKRADRAKNALIEAAMRLLPARAPSTISGRDLAAAAGVNYGLVHHYFGGKDAVLDAGLAALRDDFIRIHGNAASLRLLTGEGHPYLRALVRSQVDYPNSVMLGHDFPIGSAMVNAVARRVADRDGTDLAEASVEAKARTIAMVSIQLCYSVFGAALLDGTGVGHRERGSVDNELAALYDSLSLRHPTR